MSRKEVRDYLRPFIFHKDSMKTFWTSMAFLLVGKSFGMMSPFILKWVVNTMTAAVNAGVATTATVGLLGKTMPFTLTACVGAVGLWGLTKLVSITMLCYQMDSITSVIQDGIKRISNQSFKHLHTLDLNYHK